MSMPKGIQRRFGSLYKYTCNNEKKGCKPQVKPFQKWYKVVTSIHEKVQVGKDQEKAQSERVPTPKTEVGKNQTNNQALIP